MTTTSRTFARVWRLAIVGALVMASVPLGATPVAAASTYYVDDDGDNGGAGTSASPWRTIEYAVAQATSGDTIMVRPGTYAYEPAGEQDFPIYLPPGVRLVSTGGRDVTTIEGNGTHRVLDIANPTAGTQVSGFTITNGGPVNGSGIRITRASGGALSGWPLVSENLITGNGGAGTTYGGGIYVEGVASAVCAPRIQDNEITGNSGTYAGIACYDYSNATISGNTVSGNTLGGGILVRGESDATISGNDISFNAGTGIYASPNGFVTMDMVGNSIVGNEGSGLFLSSSNYVVQGNWITSNSTSSQGGGLSVSYGGVTATNNIWAGNHADGTGGAAYVMQGGIVFNGDTFYGNTSPSWPGVYAEDGVGNEGYVTLRNCILWNHASQKDSYGAELVEYCDTQDTNLEADANTVGAGVIHGDPRFVDAGFYDLRLRGDSPCIDAGHPSVYPATDRFGTVRPEDGDGNGNARADMGSYEYPAPVVDRFAGIDRYDTAIRTVRAWFDSADTAVIASGEDFPDALSASGLAGSYHAPLLLTRRNSVPSGVMTLLDDLGVSDVIIVGGTSAVSAAVADALDATYDVTRIWGSDRYATAANVAREVERMEDLEGNYMHWAFIARGDDFPDALALAPLSYYAGHGDDGCPILLTRPGELPSVTRSTLRDLDVRVAYVAGGIGAVSAGVKSEVDAILASNDTQWQSGRWGGADRFETAVAVAEGGIPAVAEDCEYVGIATGYNFPDALAGGAAAGGTYQGVILLTRPDSLPSATRDMLAANRQRFLWAEIYGGTAAVSDAVRTAVADALQW